MTEVKYDPIKEARVQYDRARRWHQAELLRGTDMPLSHNFAYRRLIRFGPSEVVVVREIG